MRALLRWWFASLASRRALSLSAGLLALSATAVLAVGWAIVDDVVPSLDGRFGSAQGYQGPVAPDVVPAGTPAVCSGQVRVGDYNTEAWWVRPSPVTAPMITGSALPAAGEAVISPTLSQRSGLNTGDSVQLGPHRYVVAGIGQNPDRVKQALVVLPFDDVRDSVAVNDPNDGTGAVSTCKVLTDVAIDARWAQVVPFWPRGDQDPIILFQLVVGSLFAVALVSAAALISGAFRTFTETMRPEVAALLAIGVSKRQLTGAVASAAALMGAAIGAFGIGVALIVRSVVGPAVAYSVGIEPRGGRVTVGWVAIVAAAATLCLLFGMVRPLRQVARSSLTVELTGTVNNDARWRRSALGWMGAVAVGVVMWRVSDAPSASFVSVIVVSVAGFGLAPSLLRVLGLVPGIPQPYGLLYRSKTLAGARRLAPLVRIEAASMGLGLVLLLSTNAVAAARVEHPDVRNDEMVVTSQNQWGEDSFFGDSIWPTGPISRRDIAILRQRLGPGATVEPLTAIVTEGAAPSVSSQLRWEYDVHGRDEAARTVSAKYLPVYVTPGSRAGRLAGIDEDSFGLQVFVPSGVANGNLTLPRNSGLLTAPITAPWPDTRVAPAVTISRDDAEQLGQLTDVGVLVTARGSELSPRDAAIVRDFADQRGLLTAGFPHSPIGFVRAVTLGSVVLAVLIGLAVGLLYRSVSRSESLVLRRLGVDPRQRQHVDRGALIAAALSGLGGAVVIAGGAVMALLDSGARVQWPVSTTCLIFLAGLSSLVSGRARLTRAVTGG